MQMIKFDQVIRLLKEYKGQYGDCLVPTLYVAEDGIRLGSIVNSIRSEKRKTNADEKAMLDSLGFVWKVKNSSLAFEEVISLLQEYKERHGDCLVPKSYITEDGVHFGGIVRNIRSGQRKTNADEKAKLDSLGFVWKVKKRN